jgi:hypothetical protein
VNNNVSALNECQNCGASLVGVYCAECGQRNHHKRLNLKEMVAEEFGHLLALDFSLFRTFRGLTLNPAGVCRDYIGGRRQRYMNPFKYCFTALALMLILLKLAGVPGNLGAPDFIKDVANVRMDSPRSPTAEKIMERGDIGEKFVTEHQDLVTFLVLPLFTLFLRRQYRKSGINFTEMLVLVLFVSGQTLLFKIPLVFITMFKPGLVFLVLPLMIFIYSSWALIKFFSMGIIKGILMSLFSVFLYIISLMLVVYPPMIVFVLLTL